MWEVSMGWSRVPGVGPGTTGVWLVPGEHPRVVKRLTRPVAGADIALTDPAGLGWWRREADLAESVLVDQLRGLVPTTPLDVQEDDEGITLHFAYVERAPVSPSETVRALARLATVATGGEPSWGLHDQFGMRMAALERRGGWRHLHRTPAADLADALWRRRGAVVSRLAGAVRGISHGDLTPANVLRPCAGGGVVTADWAGFGTAPLGHDLGYFSLSVPDSVETLVRQYHQSLCALGRLDVDVDEVLHAARAVAVYTAVSRADWALARVADGEGALAAKYAHPSVAVHLRALERQQGAIKHLIADGVSAAAAVTRCDQSALAAKVSHARRDPCS